MKVVLILLAALWLSVVAASWSEAAEDAGEDEPYNFSWLDPDKKVYVLQNRRYLKAGKPLLTLSLGLTDASAFRKTMVIDPRLSYYFNEHWGVEFLYQGFSNSVNDLEKGLDNVVPNATPNVIAPKNEIGVMLQWVPWYAKINVFNTVLYFDWYVAGGFGSINADCQKGGTGTAVTASKSFSGYYFGTGHQYHLNETWVVRLDYTNVWFKAPINGGIDGNDSWFTNSSFELGVGIRL